VRVGSPLPGLPVPEEIIPNDGLMTVDRHRSLAWALPAFTGRCRLLPGARGYGWVPSVTVAVADDPFLR
jgi:hypothetical protein